MKKTKISIALCALISLTSAHAQTVNVDITKAGIQATGATTFKVSNLSVFGQSTPFVVEFAWDPSTLSFRPITANFDVSEKWKVTTGIVNYANSTFSQDLAGLCASQFGFGFVQADWADIKTWINNDAAKAQTFLSSAGIRRVAGVTPPTVLVSLDSKTNVLINGFGPFPVIVTDNGVDYGLGSILANSVVLSRGDSTTQNAKVLCNNKSAA